MEYFLFSANNAFIPFHMKENTFTSFYPTEQLKMMIRNNFFGAIACSAFNLTLKLGWQQCSQSYGNAQIIQSLNNEGGALSYFVSGIYVRYFKPCKCVQINTPYMLIKHSLGEKRKWKMFTFKCITTQTHRVVVYIMRIFP